MNQDIPTPTPNNAKQNENDEVVVKAPVVNISQGSANRVEAQEVNIDRGGVNQVQANTVYLRQAGAQTVTADHLELRQGGIVRAQATNLDVTAGGIIVAQTQEANLNTSAVQLLIAQGNVKMDQSGARVLITQGDVQMEQSGAAVIVARTVKTETGSTVFLLAQKVEGTVNTSFGPRESIIFGAIAGFVFFLLSVLAGRKKKRR